MKEINIGINKLVRIPNSYANDIRIIHLEDGYYISYEQNKFGPFAKIFMDTYKEFNDDLFIYGWNADKTIIYRNGVYGLEEKDEIDTTVELVKSLKKFRKAAQPSYDECTYLGSVNVYKLENKEDNDIWAKEDGYTRRLLTSEKRLIYKTPENQVFAVNPDAPKEYSQYKKFDSFEELCIAVRRTGYDYGYEQKYTKVNNRHISSIVRKLQTHKLSDNEIQNVLNQIKNMIGIDTFRTLDFTIKSKFTPHIDIDEKEFLEALKTIDLDILEKYIEPRREEVGKMYCYNKHLLDYEDEYIIPNLQSTTTYGDFYVSYGDQEFRNFYPHTDRVVQSFNNPNLLNWKVVRAFDDTKQSNTITEANLELLKAYKEELKNSRLIDSE